MIFSILSISFGRYSKFLRAVQLTEHNRSIGSNYIYHWVSERIAFHHYYWQCTFAGWSNSLHFTVFYSVFHFDGPISTERIKCDGKRYKLASIFKSTKQLRWSARTLRMYACSSVFANRLHNPWSLRFILQSS